MKKVKWTHDGFHGLTKLAVMVPDDTKSGDQVEVSNRVAKRLDAAVCGNEHCDCGEIVSFYGQYGQQLLITVPENGATVKGYYPQT